MEAKVATLTGFYRLNGSILWQGLLDFSILHPLLFAKRSKGESFLAV